MSKPDISQSLIYQAIMAFKDKYAFDKSLSASAREDIRKFHIADGAAPNSSDALEEFQREHQAKIQKELASL